MESNFAYSYNGDPTHVAYPSKKLTNDIRAKAKEQGITEGIEQGEKNKAISIARNLKKSGIDIKIISENTGLSIEEIKKL